MIGLRLKELGLYLDTLIIGHKCCSMLSILNNIVKVIAIFHDK